MLSSSATIDESSLLSIEECLSLSAELERVLAQPGSIAGTSLGLGELASLVQASG